MTVWFTSDPHFWHDKIVQLSFRPFKNINAMHATIVTSYCAVVQPDDTVYILGDLTLRGPLQIGPVRKLVLGLPGRKHLILGNHDRLRVGSYLRMGFESVHSSLDVTLNGRLYHLVHDPAEARSDAPVVLCGHVHNRVKSPLLPGYARPTINVGMDIWGFVPVHLRAIEDMLLRQAEAKCIDI